MSGGVRLALDLGSVRIGVARCDASGILAVPMPALRRDGAWREDVDRLIAECGAVEVVVGLPVSLDGRARAAAASAAETARDLAVRIAPVPVRLVDERLTTVTAHSQLRQAGVSTRKGRSLVDSQAAAIILQSVIDTEQRSGQPPGTVVDGQV